MLIPELSDVFLTVKLNYMLKGKALSRRHTIRAFVVKETDIKNTASSYDPLKVLYSMIQYLFFFSPAKEKIKHIPVVLCFQTFSSCKEQASDNFMVLFLLVRIQNNVLEIFHLEA